MDVGGFIRSPRKPSHEKRREGMKVNARPERYFSMSLNLSRERRIIIEGAAIE